ncbi:hypothetical protein [Rhodopseudomonas sp. BR0G17]|uniref:hypothetical protein n=1 Tax=Rhodopseudomonas sp. BR0G17 TaxID=2269368 RepID=UPI0013E00342|nr:hypothetical protein [Rhodopseudomonas sp. BR0G17]NEW96921.1 hypothetical protein [Rhodopseudomonas sp. BR0G17]
MQMGGPAEFEFNESLYQCGKGACADGNSIRYALETMSAMKGPKAYVDIASFAIGFADGLLEQVRELAAARKPVTRAELHSVGAVLMPMRTNQSEAQ